MKFTLSAAIWLYQLINRYWFGASMCRTSGYATAGMGVIFVHSRGADWEVLQMHALWVLTDWSGTYRGDSHNLKFKSCEVHRLTINTIAHIKILWWTDRLNLSVFLSSAKQRILCFKEEPATLHKPPWHTFWCDTCNLKQHWTVTSR